MYGGNSPLIFFFPLKRGIMERSFLGPINQSDGDIDTYLYVFVLTIDSYMWKYQNGTYLMSISNENMKFRITKIYIFFQNFFLSFLFLVIYLVVIDENTILRIVFRIYYYILIFLNYYYFFFYNELMQIYLNIINISPVILYN